VGSGQKDIDEDYFLIVNSEGDADIGSTDDIEVMETLNLLSQNYIRINFNLIEAKLADEDPQVLKNGWSSRKISGNEKKIIDAVRSGEYKKISIRFKNGIATHLEKETVKKKDALSVLKETVNGQSFGTITLTQKDGKVINLKNVATEKL
jgi:hypothetical protein